jgi:hypothetical protein
MMVVGRPTYSVLKVEPLWQLIGIAGQSTTGHSGLPKGTQMSGQGCRMNLVVVARVEQVGVAAARGAGVTMAGLARAVGATRAKRPRAGKCLACISGLITKYIRPKEVWSLDRFRGHGKGDS